MKLLGLFHLYMRAAIATDLEHVDAVLQNPIPVCALESQPIAAQGLAEAFHRHGGLQLMGWCSTDNEVSLLVGQHTPRLLLLDPLAAAGNLLALATRLSASARETSLLVWNEGLSPAEKRLIAGLAVAHVVERNLPADDLIKMCLEIAGGKFQGGRDAASDLERGARRLTPKEAEVARLASAGLKNREIAASLGIAQGTVKVHLMHVFEKTGLRDRQQLCGFAAQLFGAPVTAQAAQAAQA